MKHGEGIKLNKENILVLMDLFSTDNFLMIALMEREKYNLNNLSIKVFLQ